MLLVNCEEHPVAFISDNNVYDFCSCSSPRKQFAPYAVSCLFFPLGGNLGSFNLFELFVKRVVNSLLEVVHEEVGVDDVKTN